MSQSNSSYHLLLNKLDAFIRKYYLNQLIRGAMLFVALLLILFLGINFLEYFLYLPSGIRKFVFFAFIGVESLVFIAMILFPAVRYLQLGKVMSRDTAANIIGKHFSEVEDRLLNILQLEASKNQSNDNSLIEASINQKSEQLKPVPFSSAVDLKSNRKYLPYVLPPLLILIVVLFAAPNLIKDSTKRIVSFDQSFERPAPFKFEILNDNLQATQSGDFQLELEVSGESLPKEVFVQIADFSYKMRAQDKVKFTYTFKNVQHSQSFRFYANGFYSKQYQLKVLPKPSIQKFEVQLDYPAYTKLKDEKLSNTGDLSIPEGTEMSWSFFTKEVDNISLILGDSIYDARRVSGNKFQFNFTAFNSHEYSIVYQNKLVEKADTISYLINAIKDAYPRIAIETFSDSTSNKQMYFTGEISDDYGLTSLKFKYKLEKKGQASPETYNQESISFNRNSSISRFNYFWDLRSLNVAPGDKLTYFFEVWDNDGVNGSKSSRSNMQYFNMSGEDELQKKAQQSNEQLKDKMEKTMSDASEIQKEAKDLKEKMLRKKELGWEDKKQMEQLVQKQQDLQEKISEIQNQFKQNQELQKEFKELDPKLAEKQKKLQELFDQVMKELFEKMQSMMEKMDKEEMMDQLEDMEMSNEQVENELDRMYELFKKFELEQKMEETLDKLEELAQKQEELKEQSEEGDKDHEAQQEKQEELSSELEKVKEDIEKMKELSKEAKQEMDPSEIEEALKEAQDESQNAEEQLGKKNSKKANQSQQSAEQKMKDAAKSLSTMMQNMQQQQMGEDLQALRQLLENLLILSHDQEALALKSSRISTNQPEYVQVVRDQNKLKDNMVLVKDSLVALSKRVFELQTFINKELAKLDKNMEQSIEHLAERKVKQASVTQQNSMTSLNNLALMLSEAMDQMQQQMAQQMPGTQQCQQPKPGQGKPKPSLSQMQQQMNQQLQDMQKQMEGEGKKPDGKEKGGSKGGMSKEMAKMAAKQAAIRDALRQLDQQENKDGNGSLGDLQKLQEEMNKTETDLVNKQLTNEMIQRQQEILTKLLDAEEAMRERELDKERKANSATEIVRETPPSLEEYFKKRDAEIQLYKTLPPSLKPYYKNLVEQYFKNITF